MAEHIDQAEYHKMVFDVLDTDGDGYLGAHQVREALIAYNMKVGLDEFDQALTELNLRDEYAFELPNIIDIINKVYEDRYNALIAKIHSVFDSHIHKKKKKLPTEDINSFIEEIGIDLEDDEELNNLLSKVDPNETGFIDYPSFENIILTLKSNTKSDERKG